MKAHEKAKRFRRACREAAKNGDGFDAAGTKIRLNTNDRRMDEHLLAGFRLGEFARKK